MSKKKERLDSLLKARYPELGEQEIYVLIFTGKVIVDNEKITKQGTMVSRDATLQILQPKSAYVSRGGEKLAGAAERFNLDFTDGVVLDVGISTGGFTDYARQNGAKWIVGIDVGYGQVAMPLQQDPKVIILERTNARKLSSDTLQKAILKANASGPQLSSITHVVMDVSFISVTQLLPVIKDWVPKQTVFTILIKPQFEARKEEIPPGGIIKDVTLRESIKERVKTALESHGFCIESECESPIQGTKGNQEYFFKLTI